MNFCYSAIRKPESIPWISLLLGSLPVNFPQDFDLLIQNPYSNLALNNR